MARPLQFTPDHSGTFEVEFQIVARRSGKPEGDPWRCHILGWAPVQGERGRHLQTEIEPIVVTENGNIATIDDIRIAHDIGVGPNEANWLSWRLVRIGLAE